MKKVLVTAAVFSLFIGAGSVSAQTLTTVEELGMRLYKSNLLSKDYTQSCDTCHSAANGFADTTAVSLGDDLVSTGGRNAPTSAYAGFSPILHQDQTGEWVGGMFWDGRATGWRLHDPLAEQAQGPPENPVEMNNTREVIVARIADPSTVDPRYADEAQVIQDLFIEVYGADALFDPDLLDLAYDYLGRAIAAYERSFEVTSFTSTFDTGILSTQEARGQKLFMKNCTTCHAYGRRGGDHPLFTNYKYVNAGVPLNDNLTTSKEDPNAHYSPPDYGLGAIPEVNDPAQIGKFKVPTLRNVARTAPYTHNGYYDKLEDVVAFMNNNTKITPEVAENLNTRNLGLSQKQLEDIVAFLNALTDDLPLPTP